MEEDEPQVLLEDKVQQKTLRNILMNCFAFGGTNVVMVCAGA